ncbi:Uncharacterised protein [Vibrio cholerae]|uniref:Uncharacterized protein n=1 Tax=Vibrio cholerae TaxID=666 RepID=A0A655Q5X2_VIBCL|nr:Uncharacterised protein [Vibrio cholerae]CSB30979.1 Uncharacterised protein [Vibrio cholerae]CSB43004.1 Uncharacterised protein [Vibrio cholerae]CSB96438.1 Uncharacterised protein [Vibrio cholerae]CSD17730.1 Uncharacterised protein [Vibrio cholerae]
MLWCISTQSYIFTIHSTKTDHVDLLDIVTYGIGCRTNEVFNSTYVIELIKMVKAHVVGNHLIGKKRAIKKVRQAL